MEPCLLETRRAPPAQPRTPISRDRPTMSCSLGIGHCSRCWRWSSTPPVSFGIFGISGRGFAPRAAAATGLTGGEFPGVCRDIRSSDYSLPRSPRQRRIRRRTAWPTRRPLADGFLRRDPQPAALNPFMSTSRELLDRLDTRHDELIQKLDDLNAQIEKALAEIFKARASNQREAIVPMEADAAGRRAA
jgi:hypothetical protein